MKKILMAATAIAALGVTSPALAQSTQGPQTQTWIVNGVNPPKCQITSSSNTATLGTDEISDDQGFARSNVGNSVAAALSALDVNAWCTGNSNHVVLTRTPLATGDGEQTTGTGGGFNQAVIYDISVDVPSYPRVGSATEATEDGPGSGPVIGRFGPTGNGEALNFSNYPTSDASRAVTSDAPGNAARTSYTALENSNRLVAGNYSSTVVLTITPGV